MEKVMRFTKMQGIGNDYVFVNCLTERVDDPPQLAKIISDRHFGIGSDGLILICPSQKADVRMRIFNADGSEAQMCGNGIRCVAKYVYEHNLAGPGGPFHADGQDQFPASLNIETGRGILEVGLDIGPQDKVRKVCVDMGLPILTPSKIPVNLKGTEVIDEPIQIGEDQLSMTCVSMGNPHAVFFCDDINAIGLERLGPAIENHKLFPERVNAHFVQVQSSKEFTMRTWERGSGLTLACGTGACACAAAAVLTGKCGPKTLAHLPGGDLQLNWPGRQRSIYMTGPAAQVFGGDWTG